MAVDEQVVKLLLVEVGLLLPAVVGEVAQFPGRLRQDIGFVMEPLQ